MTVRPATNLGLCTKNQQLQPCKGHGPGSPLGFLPCRRLVLWGLMWIAVGAVRMAKKSWEDYLKGHLAAWGTTSQPCGSFSSIV